MIESILVEKKKKETLIVIKGENIKLFIEILSTHLGEYKIKRYLKSSEGVYLLIQNGSIVDVIEKINQSIEYLVSIERKY